MALRLTVTEKLRGRKVIAVGAREHMTIQRKLLVVGTTTVTLSAGQTRTVKVVLNRAGGKLLAARHDLSVALRVVQVLSGGRLLAVSTRTLAFNAPHQRHAH